MSTSEPQPAPQAPQVTTTSPTGHTTTVPNSPPAHTNMPTQPAAATSAPTPNTPLTASPVNPTPNASADLEDLTYNEQLNAADRLWKFKTALNIALIFADIIGIGCVGWALSTTNRFPSGYGYGWDSTWSLPWGLITFSISIVWCFLCIAHFVFRKRPVHPGVRVTMDLLLWLGFLITALLTMVALFDVIYWGEDGMLGYSDGWNTRDGDYVLQRNNTWVWRQDSDSYSSGVTYERTCDASSITYTYYHNDPPFRNCAELDAYVNQLWKGKPKLARVELTAAVCQWLGLVLHFALFVWACVDCHKHRRSKVSRDAEKLAAGIVQNMVQNGAIVPPSDPTAAWQHPYHPLPGQSGSLPGQGQSRGCAVQGQMHPIYAQRMSGQRPISVDRPLPALPPRPHHQAQVGSSGEKAPAGGVAASYYEPGR